MTFHAYFQYVCLFIVWLCAISPTRMYAQKYRQQSDTHRTLLVVDKETGRPIEGAYILLENQPLASSTEEESLSLGRQIPRIQFLYRVWATNLNIYI